MADPRFFLNVGPFTLKQVIEICDARVHGTHDTNKSFVDVQPLNTAQRNDISFLDNPVYKNDFLKSSAGACIVKPGLEELAPKGMILLISSTPYHAYAKIASAFYQSDKLNNKISSQAIIHNTAKIGKNCEISPGVVVEANVEVSNNCKIKANAVIGRGCIIGSNTIIDRGATLSFCIVGANTIIHQGVRIGCDGFGFALGSHGHIKVPQLGRVIIGDHVEIGANSTIDRGSGPDTVIKDNVKIDNLVQIAHNVEIAQGCVIVSQAGIAGSTKLGEFVMVGGQAGIAGHLVIGPGAKIAGKSGVMRNIEPNISVFGTPAKAIKTSFRELTTLEKLAKKSIRHEKAKK